MDLTAMLGLGGAATTLVKLSNSKVAEKLIEKIAQIQQIHYEPTRIVRAASAEGEADKIKALARIEVSEIEHRALRRMVREEGRYQQNMEAITSKAALKLNEDARPEEIKDDWLVDFFAKSRTVSDEAMQGLWAKLLSEEANSPSTVSRQAVSIVSMMESSQARMFERLCNYCWTWTFTTPLHPFIFDLNNEIYRFRQMTLSDISELESLGLVRLDHSVLFQLPVDTGTWIRYQGRGFEISPKNPDVKSFPYGHVMLTNAGSLLARVCELQPVDGLVEYVEKVLGEHGFVLNEVPQVKN